MPDLQYREEKMKDVKRNHNFKTFLKEIVSRYPIVIYKNHGLLSIYPDTPRSCPLVSTKEFEELRENFTDKGIDYDPALNFFENFKKLYHQTPFPALYNFTGAENCDYAFSAYMSKNCYLSFTIITNCENVLYSFTVKENSSNVLNSSQVRNNSENVYMALGVINSMNIFYSRYVNNCSDLRFCTNMVWCHNCMMCDGLENQNYYIKNKEYSKEEYAKKSQEILSQKALYPDFFKALSYEGQNYWSTATTGKFVLKSQDVVDGLYSLEIKDGHNVMVLGGSYVNTHMYDVFEGGAHGNTDFRGAINVGVKSDSLYNAEWIVTCSHLYYCRFLEYCSYCIGCIGLKNKEFCIFNKQYTKEERYILADKIFAQMEKDWILGEYFPWSMNPFYFNDTIASLVWDFTKEEVTKEGYLRRDEPIKVDIPQWADIISTKDLASYQWFDANGNWTINPEILKKVIKDEKGTGTSPAKLENCYRIVPMELEFLQKKGLPLPEIHRLDRIKLNFKST